MDIRAKNYLQEVRELYLAAEQDEEVAQGYLLLAEKCKLKKYMELLEKARDKADQSAAVYNQRKQIVIEQIKELKYSVFVHVLMGIYYKCSNGICKKKFNGCMICHINKCFIRYLLNGSPMMWHEKKLI